MIPVNRNEPELLEEYRLPVGAEVLKKQSKG